MTGQDVAPIDVGFGQQCVQVRCDVVPVLRALDRIAPAATGAVLHADCGVAGDDRCDPTHVGGGCAQTRVKLSASVVTVFDRAAVVARHQRAAGKGVQVLELDHYLEILLRKPGALPGATALVQARTAGIFTPTHDAFWAAARKALGDSAGTRALVEVLLLHRHLEHADVLAGISAALTVGSVNADVVAVEARKAAQQRGAASTPVEAAPRGRQVVSLTERRLAELPGDDRPLPSVDAYDDLLGKASS